MDKIFQLNSKTVSLALGIISVVGIIATLFLGLLVITTGSGIETLNEEITGLQSEISNLTALNSEQEYKIVELEQKTRDVEKEKTEVEEEKTDLETKYTNLQEEIDNTLNELSSFKTDIDASMDWFKENSTLSNDNTQINTSIQHLCFKIDASSCKVRLGCLFLVNSEELHYKYKYDVDAEGEIDKLLSLEEFMRNKGGDCEDYALFFKAEFNYFLDACASRGGGKLEDKSIYLEAWENSPYKNYTLDFQNSWYLSDATAKNIGLGYYFPNIVCGMMYDPQIEDVGGHCVMAFTKRKIQSIEDIYSELNGAPLVEPQTGEFLGHLNETDSKIYINDSYDDTEHNEYIFGIISDEDHYMYDNEREINWLGYETFKGILDEKEKELEETKATLAN